MSWDEYLRSKALPVPTVFFCFMSQASPFRFRFFRFHLVGEDFSEKIWSRQHALQNRQRGAARDEKSEDFKSEDHAAN